MPYSAFAGNDADAKRAYQALLDKDVFMKLVQNGNQRKSLRFKHFDDTLQANGHLDKPTSIGAGDLTGPIHPIFGIENWDDTNEHRAQAHAAMMPAFQLATIWITKDEMLDWFIRVQRAKDYGLDQGKYVLSSCSPETYDAAKLYKARRKVKERFDLMATEVKFFWQPKDAKGNQAKGNCHYNEYHALADLRDTTLPRITMEQTDKYHELAPRIGITTQRLYHLVSPWGVCHNAHASQQLRFLFKLAVDLVHELCHAFYEYKQLDGFPSFVHKQSCCEPYTFSTDSMPEMGHSWERATFGVVLTDSEGDFGDSGPLLAKSYDYGFSDAYIAHVVPTQIVERMFYQVTWNDRPLKLCQALDAIERPFYWVRRWYHDKWHNMLYHGKHRVGFHPPILRRNEIEDAGTERIPRNVAEWFRQTKANDELVGGKNRDARRKIANFLGPRGAYAYECYDTDGSHVCDHTCGMEPPI